MNSVSSGSRPASTLDALPLPSQNEEQRLRWNEHEFDAEGAKLQAQKLIDVCGSPALAKQAIDNLTREAHGPDNGLELARELGFESYTRLLVESELLSSPDGRLWRIVEIVGGQWVIWDQANASSFQRFDSREHGQAAVGVNTLAASDVPGLRID